MAHIQPISTHPGLLQQQQQEGQLGTEGFDFMTYLLGLQANPIQDWWQNGSESEFKLPEDMLKSGQDAAMPMAADQLGALLQVQNQMVPTAVTTELSTEEVAATQVLSEKPLSVAELLKSPPEDMQPAQMKELVDRIWGKSEEVKAVKVEALPESHSLSTKPEARSDAMQHAVLQRMAAARSEELRTSQDSNLPVETVAMSSEGFDRLSDKSESFPSARNERKEGRSDSASFNLLPDGIGDRQEMSVSETTKPTEGGPVLPKLMPQVLPRVEELAQQGGGKVTVLLDPPDMGRLTIEVTTRGKNVELAIHSDSDKTRAVLEGGMADLRQAMQSNDLQLTRAEVHGSDHSTFSSMQFSDSHQQGREQSSQQEGYRSHLSDEQQTWSRNLLTETPITRTRNAGRLDVRV